MIHAFKNPDDLKNEPEWKGRVFESAVGAELAKLNGDLYYWSDGKFEVDFVLKLESEVFAIEVKSGRRKNSRGLEKFLEKYPQSIPILIDDKKGEQLLRSHKIDSILLRSLI